ncbi:hypothetical protein Pmani_033303 [Petrolisthes manimaculis]|uniref:Uncharacterized protein n=1 Tax=Petrolisthes manimaculis TaxID=1843537 RepID=A0AAE1NRJ6_9EUCA|nr:hypothetical protein Pmani_033303 [Petrolisthes manimaculis]
MGAFERLRVCKIFCWGQGMKVLEIGRVVGDCGNGEVRVRVSRSPGYVNGRDTGQLQMDPKCVPPPTDRLTHWVRHTMDTTISDKISLDKATQE